MENNETNSSNEELDKIMNRIYSKLLKDPITMQHLKDATKKNLWDVAKRRKKELKEECSRSYQSIGKQGIERLKQYDKDHCEKLEFLLLNKTEVLSEYLTKLTNLIDDKLFFLSENIPHEIRKDDLAIVVLKEVFYVVEKFLAPDLINAGLTVVFNLLEQNSNMPNFIKPQAFKKVAREATLEGFQLALINLFESETEIKTVKYSNDKDVTQEN